MSKKKNKKVAKRRKIKKKAIIFSLLFIIVAALFIYYIYNIKITNIYIVGNEYLSDYEIIKKAKLESYPNSLQNSSKLIKERLEKSDFILNVDVKKKSLFQEVYIYIDENIPVFYYQTINKVVLKDGKKIDGKYNVPTLTNEVDDKIYKKLIDKMCEIDSNVFLRISEIKYDPNDIDTERFYLTMDDGNYVYLTLNKFNKINSYLEIVKTFNDSKGILYLDSGEYFEIFNRANE